jgi:hypothetical protein
LDHHYLDSVYPKWRREAKLCPQQANLSGANLEEANLAGAVLPEANLSFADLFRADLNGANLVMANLSRADLTGTDLGGARLYQANLSEAILRNTNLSDALLDSASLTGATYAPEPKPPNPDVAGIVGLSTLKVPPGQEIGLVQLRKLLEDGGLQDAAREATDSIQRAVTLEKLSQPFWSFAWFEGAGRFVAFDLTTAYGLQPLRALLIIVGLGCALTFVYMWPILNARKHPEKEHGIYQVFPAARIDQSLPATTLEKELQVIRVQAESWWRAFGQAAYFSLLSAVNIGFEQFAPGDWVRRMQDREYTLEAIGWVRIVAGTQSILSVYLAAMWVFTQFGRPFG